MAKIKLVINRFIGRLNIRRKYKDAFKKGSDEAVGTAKEPALECIAAMLNINYGHNKELLDKCKRLHDYAYFVREAYMTCLIFRTA